MTELEDAFREIERLRRENEDLRKHLGVADVPVPLAPPPKVSEEAPPPPVLPSKPLPTVDVHSSIQEKIGLFRMLFRGSRGRLPGPLDELDNRQEGLFPGLREPLGLEGQSAQRSTVDMIIAL